MIVPLVSIHLRHTLASIWILAPLCCLAVGNALTLLHQLCKLDRGSSPGCFKLHRQVTARSSFLFSRTFAVIAGVYYRAPVGIWRTSSLSTAASRRKQVNSFHSQRSEILQSDAALAALLPPMPVSDQDLHICMQLHALSLHVPVVSAMQRAICSKDALMHTLLMRCRTTQQKLSA